MPQVRVRIATEKTAGKGHQKHFKKLGHQLLLKVRSDHPCECILAIWEGRSGILEPLHNGGQFSEGDVPGGHFCERARDGQLAGPHAADGLVHRGCPW